MAKCMDLLRTDCNLTFRGIRVDLPLMTVV